MKSGWEDWGRGKGRRDEGRRDESIRKETREREGGLRNLRKTAQERVDRVKVGLQIIRG